MASAFALKSMSLIFAIGSPIMTTALASSSEKSIPSVLLYNSLTFMGGVWLDENLFDPLKVTKIICANLSPVFNMKLHERTGSKGDQNSIGSVLGDFEEGFSCVVEVVFVLSTFMSKYKFLGVRTLHDCKLDLFGRSDDV